MFNESNNISSVLMAKDYLSGAYVMEADLLLANPRVVRKYEYCSNYLGEYREMTDDWCFDVKKGIIRKLNVGGTNCYHMFGISFWSKEDGKRLAECVEKTCEDAGVGRNGIGTKCLFAPSKRSLKWLCAPAKRGIWWRSIPSKS